MTSAARRASLLSSIVQQPRAPGAVRLRVAREREVDAGDVVAGLDGAGGGDRRVDAAGHGGEDPHPATTGTRPRGPARPRADRLDERVDVGRRWRCGRARSAASGGPARRRSPWPAARARAAARRPSRPSRSSTRCRGRRAASAASRPRSRGRRGGRCRAAGGEASGSPLQVRVGHDLDAPAATRSSRSAPTARRARAGP